MNAWIVEFHSHIIPADILDDPQLNERIKGLPPHYNFEIHKTIWQLKRNRVRRVALQFPEGLLLYACVLGDILERFASVETVIMGDVTYGACCVDDFTALALECDYMVHYGHSCLVPVDITTIKILYVFVDISVDISGIHSMIQENFQPECTIALVSTVQFLSAIYTLQSSFSQNSLSKQKIIIPQSKPLSKGEILGCTAPPVKADYIVYVGDGRFHLEAMMIANPSIEAYRFDPYSRVFSREYYDHEDMHKQRRHAIEAAKHARTVGLILGTLGRQGNLTVMNRLRQKFKDLGIECILVLISEITPLKLSKFSTIDAWVQVACPRLSIDWGYGFNKPILTPYEASVCFTEEISYQSTYPMDYYSKTSLGPWTNYHSNETTKQG